MLPSSTGLRLGCWLLVIHPANDFPSKSKIQPSLFSFGVSSLSTARAEETAAPRAISIHPSLVLISDYPFSLSAQFCTLLRIRSMSCPPCIVVPCEPSELPYSRHFPV